MAITKRDVMNSSASGEACQRVLDHIRIFGGRFTTAGGAAAEDFTVAGVAATDAIFAMLNVEGSSPVSIVKAEYQAADTVRVTFSADPSTDHEISIQVIRP